MKNRKLTLLMGCAIFLGSLNMQADHKPDWMLDNSSYKAVINERGKDVVLSNGLVERVFRRGTTVQLNHLVTGEGLLRSVRPETELVLNNIRIPVGGLTGQPIHNYLLPEWLDQLHDDSLAFSYVGYETGEIQSRFDWKPRREWMASQPNWPSKGKELILKFQADENLVRRLSALNAELTNRETLVEADFTHQMPKGWKVVTSLSNRENAFRNEGKTGEILVPANTAVYAEKSIPGEATAVVAKLNPGTDQSASWGPGLTWVFDKKTIKTYLRPGKAEFGVTGVGAENEMTFAGYQPGRTVYLMMERQQKAVACHYSYDGKNWTLLTRIPLEGKAVAQCVRIGKTDVNGGNGEFSTKGEAGRCRVDELQVLGKWRGDVNSEYAFLKDLEVKVHYEIYDGIPLISKWFTIDSKAQRDVTVTTYKSEILAVMEPENTAKFHRSFLTPNITVESDFAHVESHDELDRFNNNQTQHHVHWNTDPLYKTQVDWLRNIPCLLESYPEFGPEITLLSGGTFVSHRVWELYHDTWDRERKGLQIRRMYRTAAPWVVENPIFMHVRNADNASVKKAIDQCAEVGFEMVIMTFWSGVNLEDNSAANLQRMKELADYAHAKGVALGGYSLLGSRSINAENDVIIPGGKSPVFGYSPCLGSEWGIDYIDKLRTYFEETGQDILEHDGSYPGDECASTRHPGHKGLADSQWNQFQTIKKLYQDFKSKGIFLNIPDWYFMNGQNKTGMGYRETNWSLPRKQQEIIERQNIYDGTWVKAPSMGWMMVPLVEYQGGGKAATIEPLCEHLPHYEMRLANNFGAGVMACYRGPQLYDSPETKEVVKRWVDFYKQHRGILDSDIIHLRRPDGRDWDGLLHVNPLLKEKGLMMVYNPLQHPIKRTISVPLYYTGLTNKVLVRDSQGKRKKYRLNRDYTVEMEIEIPARYCNWYTFE